LATLDQLQGNPLQLGNNSLICHVSVIDALHQVTYLIEQRLMVSYCKVKTGRSSISL
jgi:hypothetical protein